jgi:hypothetical protein
MNQILVPSDGSYCTWGYPCVYQYYSYWALASLVVVASTQFLVVKVCRLKTVLTAPRSSVSFLIVLFLIIIQWRYLIAASQYVPKKMFAASVMNSLDCDESTKGGKLSGSKRDCVHGQLTNCSLQVPCTVCNPIYGMDESAVWNWWVNQKNQCGSCNTTTSDCEHYEQKSICSKTFDGPLFDGSIRKSTLETAGSNPLEFWRTKQTFVSSVCLVFEVLIFII